MRDSNLRLESLITYLSINKCLNIVWGVMRQSLFDRKGQWAIYMHDIFFLDLNVSQM